MNIYLIKRKREDVKLDEAAGFVVREKNDLAARKRVADGRHWREEDFGYWIGDEGFKVWLDPTQSTCQLLAENVKGDPMILLRDFNRG